MVKQLKKKLDKYVGKYRQEQIKLKQEIKKNVKFGAERALTVEEKQELRNIGYAQ